MKNISRYSSRESKRGMSGATLDTSVVADLSRAILSGADIQRGRPQRGELGGADLSGANLSEADLRRRRDLSGRLIDPAQQTSTGQTSARRTCWATSRADLSAGQPRRSEPQRSELRQRRTLARRTSTGRTSARRTSAEAIVGYTTFADVDLSTVKGIETIKHTGAVYNRH